MILKQHNPDIEVLIIAIYRDFCQKITENHKKELRINVAEQFDEICLFFCIGFVINVF